MSKLYYHYKSDGSVSSISCDGKYIYDSFDLRQLLYWYDMKLRFPNDFSAESFNTYLLAVVPYLSGCSEHEETLQYVPEILRVLHQVGYDAAPQPVFRL